MNTNLGHKTFKILKCLNTSLPTTNAIIINNLVSAHFENVDEEYGHAMYLGIKLTRYTGSKGMKPYVIEFLEKYGNGLTIHTLDKLLENEDVDVIVLLRKENTLYAYPITETD